MRRVVRIEDAITVVFCLFMAALTLWRHRDIPFWGTRVAVDMAVVALSIAIPLLARRFPGRCTALARDWYPVLAVTLVFFNLKGVVAGVNPHDYDPQLIAIDRWLCGGVDPTRWIERFANPWLDEYLQVAYTSYYLIPIVTGVGLYTLRENYPDDTPFRRAVVVFLLTFYLSYLGYLLVPAIGPRFTLPHSRPLQGVFLTPYLKRFINTLEPTARDCFPSGHTAVSVAALMLAFRHRRRLFWWLLPVVLSLIVSTVYHRYHYLVDVIAGVALGVLCFFAGEWLFRAWGTRWG